MHLIEVKTELHIHKNWPIYTTAWQLSNILPLHIFLLVHSTVKKEQESILRPVCVRYLQKTPRQMRRGQPVRAHFLLSKFPRKAKDHPAAQSTTPISCAELICINVSKGCRSILAGAFIGCAAVKQCRRIGRANARKGREKTNIISALCSSFLP